MDVSDRHRENLLLRDIKSPWMVSRGKKKYAWAQETLAQTVGTILVILHVVYLHGSVSHMTLYLGFIIRASAQKVNRFLRQNCFFGTRHNPACILLKLFGKNRALGTNGLAGSGTRLTDGLFAHIMNKYVSVILWDWSRFL